MGNKKTDVVCEWSVMRPGQKEEAKKTFQLMLRITVIGAVVSAIVFYVIYRKLCEAVPGFAQDDCGMELVKKGLMCLLILAMNMVMPLLLSMEKTVYQIRVKGMSSTRKFVRWKKLKGYVVSSDAESHPVLYILHKNGIRSTLYLPNELEEQRKIVDALKDYLPMLDTVPDPPEKISNQQMGWMLIFTLVVSISLGIWIPIVDWLMKYLVLLMIFFGPGTLYVCLFDWRRIKHYRYLAIYAFGFNMLGTIVFLIALTVSHFIPQLSEMLSP